MDINLKKTVIELTSLWQGDRFDDGRPKVCNEDIELVRNLSIEEIWMPLYVNGYKFQYEGDLKLLHTEKRLVGRAVTCCFMPTRPDLQKAVIDNYGDGKEGSFNQWVVESLVSGDVLVADMFDKIFNGTFVGGNLTTAIASKTKNGGAIIWGGIRDLKQMEKIKNVQVLYRGIDPTPIRECVITSHNSVCRIGKAVCLPGDIVVADSGGVIFIPSHMVKVVIDGALKAQIRDIFGFEQIEKGGYTSTKIDNAVWSKNMLVDLIEFIKTDNRGEKYRNLDWSVELKAADGDEDSLKEVLKTNLF